MVGLGSAKKAMQGGCKPTLCITQPRFDQNIQLKTLAKTHAATSCTSMHQLSNAIVYPALLA
jgi:hypothetical protein